jgi:hypothetical protein
MTERVNRTDWELLQRVFLCTVVFACIPLDYTLKLRITGIPILNGFLLATAFTVMFCYTRKYKGRFHPLVAISIGAGVFLCGITLTYQDRPAFDSRGALQDILSYAGLPVGIALGQFCGRDRFMILVRRCFVAVSITFAISIVLLLRGYIQSAGGDERLLDPAMYTSSFLIAVFFPGLWFTAGVKRTFWRGVAIGGLLLNLVFAMISATRSVLITLIAAIAITAIIEIKKDFRNMIWVCGILIAFGAYFQGERGWEAFESTLLGERLTSTEFQNEDRFEELNMMLDQMGPAEWIHGVGFGSGFESPVTRNSETGSLLALGPHIGITTLLYKGGLPAMLLLIATPCLLCLWRVVFARHSRADPFAAGVTVYLVQSCISGGWGFFALLVLGSLFTLTRERAQAARELIVVSPWPPNAQPAPALRGTGPIAAARSGDTD